QANPERRHQRLQRGLGSRQGIPRRGEQRHCGINYGADEPEQHYRQDVVADRRPLMGLAVLLLNLLPGLIAGIPGISASIKQIIADVTASASAVVSSGAITQPSINTI